MCIFILALYTWSVIGSAAEVTFWQLSRWAATRCCPPMGTWAPTTTPPSSWSLTSSTPPQRMTLDRWAFNSWWSYRQRCDDYGWSRVTKIQIGRFEILIMNQSDSPRLILSPGDPSVFTSKSGVNPPSNHPVAPTPPMHRRVMLLQKLYCYPQKWLRSQRLPWLKAQIKVGDRIT